MEKTEIREDPNFTIGLAKAEDFEQMQQLMADLAVESYLEHCGPISDKEKAKVKEYYDVIFRKALKNKDIWSNFLNNNQPGDRRFWVVRMGDKVIGVSVATVQNSERGYVNELAQTGISKEFRRMGIAREFLEAEIAWIKSRAIEGGVAGDIIIHGEIYTANDASQSMLMDLINRNHYQITNDEMKVGKPDSEVPAERLDRRVIDFKV